MSEEAQSAQGTGPSYDVVEIGMAVAVTAFGAIVVYGSLLAGIDWASDGPRAGFFPFYIGVFIVISGVIILVQAIRSRSQTMFASWSQLRQVTAVVVPATIYVAVIPTIGIYVSSVFLIALFMRWLGRYRWPMLLAVSVGVPLFTFIIFERWFLVPLPKGPLEEYLGY